MWWGALGGLGLAALVVVGLSLAGVISWDRPATAGTSAAGSTAAGTPGTTEPADTRVVDLPDRAGPYLTLQAASADFTAAAKPSGVLDNAAANERLTADAVGRSYGTTAVGVRSYATDDLRNLASAFAVRAPSPLLEVLPAQDPERLGLGAPIQEIVTVGDVRCLVDNGTVVAGNQPDPEDIRVLQCQRTGPNLTVVIFPSGELTAEQVATAVDDIWDSVSG